MSEILQTRLLELIREDLGGTYSITANAGYTKEPKPTYLIRIQFGSDPQRNAELVGRVLAEVDNFKTNGPTPKQLEDERQALLRDFETNTKLNPYLIGQLAFQYQYGEGAAHLLGTPAHHR